MKRNHNDFFFCVYLELPCTCPSRGKSLNDAIKEAGELRFLPIVLTSLTAIGGLLPIALSSNPLISPLALVLIGGLISSTLLSRIVTPVIYKLLPPRIGSVETAKR
jgi:multidrug efflux pump subunit AcrB